MKNNRNVAGVPRSASQEEIRTADVLSAKFGFDTAPFEDLIYWADLIDSASFRREPAA